MRGSRSPFAPENGAFPLWAILLGLAVFAGGIALGHRETADAVANPALWDDAAGRPLDYAGNILKCPDCGSILFWQERYRYQCDRCPTTLDAKYDSATGRIDFFR